MSKRAGAPLTADRADVVWGALRALPTACLACVCLVGVGLLGCSNPPKSQFPDAASAIASVRQQHACSRGLRGESLLDSFDAQGRVRVRTLFMVHHPRDMRFDVLSPLEATMATLTVSGKQFALLDQQAKTFHTGPSSECNVERFLRVPVPPEALVQLLAGEVPLLESDSGVGELTWERGRYVISVEGRHEARQRIELTPAAEDWELPWQEQRLRVTRVEVVQGDATLYTVELADYEPAAQAAPRQDPDGLSADVPPSGPACSAAVPMSVRFVVPIAGRDVIFKHKRIEHNPPLVDGSFTQPVPGGVRVERAVCER